MQFYNVSGTTNLPTFFCFKYFCQKVMMLMSNLLLSVQFFNNLLRVRIFYFSLLSVCENKPVDEIRTRQNIVFLTSHSTSNSLYFAVYATMCVFGDHILKRSSICYLVLTLMCFTLQYIQVWSTLKLWPSVFESLSRVCGSRGKLN